MIVDDFEIVNALVCDDVRHESSGKEILIGVYGSTILVPRFPASISPRLWIQARPLKAGETKIFARALNEHEAVFFEGSGSINADEPGELGVFTVGGVNIQVHSDMNLIFQLKIDSGEWTNVLEIPIKLQSQSGHTLSDWEGEKG